MKIVHIITCIDRGGAQNQVVQMLIELNKSNFNVGVVFLKGNGYWTQKLINNGIKVFGPIFPSGNYLDWRGYLRLKKILRFDPKILHLHMPPSLLVGVIFKIFFNKLSKLIYTSHNECPFIKIPIIELFFSKFLLSKTDHIITVSKSGKEYISKRYFINEKKISIIFNCFNEKLYNLDLNFQLKEFLFYSKKYRYIGTIARLVPQKRIDLLLKSFSKICRNEEDIKLVIIGSGFLDKKLLRKSRNLNIPKDKIIWIKNTEYPIHHLKKWDLFCLTSEYETFGVVFLESIFSKTPILAMDVSSVKDIIGPCGEVVKFGDYKKFSEKIIQIINQKNLYINPEYLKRFTPIKNCISHKKTYEKFLEV